MMFLVRRAKKFAQSPGLWSRLLLTTLLGLPGLASPQIPAVPIGDTHFTDDGDGFFILEQGSERSFARVAVFQLDQNKLLVNEDGRSIFGFGVTANGAPNGALGPIPLNVVSVAPGDGLPSGFLEGISFDEQGFVNASFSNGVTRRLAQIALAVFPDPRGLKNVGTRFLQTEASGSPVIGSPGTSTYGTLQAGFTDSCERELDICVFTGSVDLDGDGVVFANDRCPGTLMPSEVDDAGCSRQQFCMLIDTSRRRGPQMCRRSDWKNDEPLRGNPRDCRLIRDPAQPSEFLCIARSN